ncbi:MAG: hydrogenase formation protein HypD [Bacteroidales bacterium]|nr:MAG: hydrogenase formation protein HypD [Bacteroidales bacterium]
MKYIDEFRDKDLVQELSRKIKQISVKRITIMEVCGGHTMAIHKFGIPSLLPENIDLLSGPGCPVCVTDIRFIDRVVAISRLDNTIITTYGDLIRVPGSSSSLDKEKANGADIRVVYSTLEALEIAKHNKDKKVIFPGIGFETTTPSSAIAILEASKKDTDNFFLYSSHKVMPPAMAALIDEGIKIDGYIGPGHVTTVAGAKMYDDLANKYKLSIVISGFEPVDLMQSIYFLVRQLENNKPKVEIQYKRAVNYEGNLTAQHMINEVFELRDDWWRGLGVLPGSGLGIRKKYESFDAEKQIEVEVEKPKEPKGCICGEILKGLKRPTDCKLFRSVCTPSYPVGTCMVSNEGTCQAYYNFRF